MNRLKRYHDLVLNLIDFENKTEKDINDLTNDVERLKDRNCK